MKRRNLLLLSALLPTSLFAESTIQPEIRTIKDQLIRNLSETINLAGDYITLIDRIIKTSAENREIEIKNLVTNWNDRELIFMIKLRDFVKQAENIEDKQILKAYLDALYKTLEFLMNNKSMEKLALAGEILRLARNAINLIE